MSNEDTCEVEVASPASRLRRFVERLLSPRDSSLALLVVLYSLFSLAKLRGTLALERHAELPAESFVLGGEGTSLSPAEVEIVCDALRLFCLGVADSEWIRRSVSLDVSGRFLPSPLRRARASAILEGLVAHAEGHAPQLSIEFARLALPLWARPSFRELEEALMNASFER